MKVEVARRPGLPVLMSLTVSVDIKQHWTMHTLALVSLSLICQPTSDGISSSGE